MIKSLLVIYSKYDKTILRFMENIEETDTRFKLIEFCKTGINNINQKLPIEWTEEDRDKLEILVNICDYINYKLKKS